MMDAWLPVNHKIQANVEIAGVKGEVTYVSSLKYSEVILNPNLPEAYFSAINGLKKETEPEVEEEISASKEQEKINELLQKEELTNRDVARLSKLMEKETQKDEEGKKAEDLNQTGTKFSVDKDAVKNDSTYWNQVRPIPLTPEEHTTLRTRDSILGPALLNKPKTGSVTSASRRGKPSFRSVIIGKTYVKKQGRFRFSHGGLFDMDMLGYNTVDGVYYGQDFRLDWRVDSLYRIRSRLKAGYAFHRKAPLITFNSELLYAPMARGKVAFNARYTSSDFNGYTGIPKLTNLAYTLLLRENQIRLYEQIEATLYNRIDITNGLVLTTSAKLGRHHQLNNHSDFSILFSKRKELLMNTPADIPENDPGLANNQKLEGFIQLEYTPQHYYVIRNHRKDMRDSKWPTLSLSYRQTFPVEATGWSDFRVMQFGIRHNWEVGLLSRLYWSLQSGYFLEAESIHFSDFKHFKASPLLVDMAGFDQALMLMDYYEASTNEYWTSASATLTSSYLMLKFLPWFSERLWKESVGISYLYTPQTPHYIQVGYSLNELFFLVDIGVFAAFQEGSYKGIGARLNFRF